MEAESAGSFIRVPASVCPRFCPVVRVSSSVCLRVCAGRLRSGSGVSVLRLRSASGVPVLQLWSASAFERSATAERPVGPGGQVRFVLKSRCRVGRLGLHGAVALARLHAMPESRDDGLYPCAVDLSKRGTPVLFQPVFTSGRRLTSCGFEDFVETAGQPK